MGAFYTPGVDYDLNTWLDNLGAYSLDEGTSEQLSIARQITESGLYYFMGVPFPGFADILIPGRETFTGNITVPPLSYLMSLTGDAVDSTTGLRSGQGWQFRIYDKGAKMDTFMITSFGSNQPSSGRMTGVNPNAPNNRPVGPYFPLSPMVVLAPGSLQLTVTNLNPNACWIQMLLQMAVPISRMSSNEMLIKGSRMGR